MSNSFKRIVARWRKYLKSIVSKWNKNYKTFKLEELQMVDMYVALIIAGRRTIDTTPEKFREAVLADLNALGLDGYGNPIVEAE